MKKLEHFLNSMGRKPSIPLLERVPHADPMPLRLLQRLLAFDPAERPSAEEALADPYFHGLTNLADEPSMKPISKFEFEFERRKLTKDGARKLIQREILEYHPEMLQEHVHGAGKTGFLYPSGLDGFKHRFADLEENNSRMERSALLYRKYASLPRERVCAAEEDEEETDRNSLKKENAASVVRARATILSPPRCRNGKESGRCPWKLSKNAEKPKQNSLQVTRVID